MSMQNIAFTYSIYMCLVIYNLLFIFQVNPDKVLTGNIINEENKPVAYAHIGIEGSKIGTISDERGEFKLDISGMSDSDILKVSSVGYKSQSFTYSQLPTEEKLNIVLKKHTYTRDDIDVIATKTKKKTFGSIKTERNSGWSFSGIADGNQIGMMFKNTDHVVLSNLNFHVETKGYDSLLYRLNFFEINNAQLIQINKEEILTSSAAGKRVVSVGLDKYDISLSNNFAVTIEVLRAWKNEDAEEQTEIVFTGRNSFQKRMLQKSHQFAPIEYDNIKLNIFIESYYLSSIHE